MCYMLGFWGWVGAFFQCGMFQIFHRVGALYMPHVGGFRVEWTNAAKSKSILGKIKSSEMLGGQIESS